MIRSMTGFAAVGREENGDKVNITVKSVNHRFLDIAMRVPQSLGALESRIRAVLQQRLTRGRVEVSLSVETTAAPARDVVLDEGLLDRIAQALDAARARGLVTGTLSVSDVLRLPQVLDIRQKGEGTAPGASEPLARLVDRTIRVAVDALVAMRETEGGFLEADISARLATMAGFVDELEQLAREGQRQLEHHLRERLAALPNDVTGDPAALAQEVVRFVARSDVDEEIVRLRGHFEHWRQLTVAAEPCGRKLDFLVQEMNREINTIGSKVESAKGTGIVISAKAELERVREQIQNVE